MTVTAAATRHIPWPPIVAITALVLGIATQKLAPAPWIGQPLSDILFMLGLLLMAGFALITFAAVRMLLRAKTTVTAGRPPEHLVTGGPYSFTRNPIYVGYVMLILGAALAAGNLWLLPLALAAGFAIQWLAIRPEEREMKSRFGKRYLDYAKRVRRWL